jgi:hypothetical protein
LSIEGDPGCGIWSYVIFVYKGHFKFQKWRDGADRGDRGRKGARESVAGPDIRGGAEIEWGQWATAVVAECAKGGMQGGYGFAPGGSDGDNLMGPVEA